MSLRKAEPLNNIICRSSKILKNLFIKIYSVHQLISCSTYKKITQMQHQHITWLFFWQCCKKWNSYIPFPLLHKMQKKKKKCSNSSTKMLLNVNLWSWVHNVKFEMVLSPSTRNLASRSSCTWLWPLQMNLTSTSHIYTAPLTLILYFTIKNKVSIVYN